MIQHRFDIIARFIATLSSRRSALAILVGAVVALLNLKQGADSPVDAAQRRRRQHGQRCPKKRRCGRRCCGVGMRCRGGVCRRLRPPAPSELDSEPDPGPGPDPDPEPDPDPDPDPDPSPIRVRRNVHALDENGPELEALARGISAMMQRSQSDPTSWLGQAAIHQQGRHQSVHFLSWHRMYLYWFERIVRKASGDSTLTLPYWDYAVPSQRILPAPFRDPNNALHISQRNPDVNAGQQPTNTSIFNTSNAFATTTFMHAGSGTSFGGSTAEGGAVEGTPHNGVHGWVGGANGFMRSTQTAPSDPLFWLHHANIDRMWEEWLRLGGGRANTNNPTFLNTTFTFVDENGAPVNMNGSQILDTVGQLGYRYDDQPASTARATTARARTALAPAKRAASKVVAATAPSRTIALHRNTINVGVPVTKGGVATISGARKSAGSRLTLTFNGVAGTGVHGVLFEVYLGTPSGGRSKLVGTLALFGLQPDEQGAHGHAGANLSFDVTGAVGAGAKRIAVTLVPVNLTGSGSLPGGTLATIDRIVLSVQGAAATTKNKKPKKQTPQQRKKARQAKKAKQRLQQPRRKQQRRTAAPRRRTTNRRQKRTGLSQPAQTTVTSSLDLGLVPGNKSSAGDRAVANGASEVAETSHPHH